MNADGVKDDIERLVDELGEPFEWSNGSVTKEYKGIFSPRTEVKDYEIGGYNQGYEWDVVCHYDSFDIGLPGVGDTIIKRGTHYRITQVINDPYQAAIEFSLTEEDE